MSGVATAMQRIDLDPVRLAEQRVVVLRAPDFIVGLGILPFRALYRAAPAALVADARILIHAAAATRARRSGRSSSRWQRARSTRPVSMQDDVIDLDGMRVSVLAHDGAGPTRVAFQFDRPLEDASLVFLTWSGDRFDRVVVPASWTSGGGRLAPRGMNTAVVVQKRRAARRAGRRPPPPVIKVAITGRRQLPVDGAERDRDFEAAVRRVAAVHGCAHAFGQAAHQGRPRPVPLLRRVSSLSPPMNGSKILPSWRAGTPGP